jgi:hypothetical protein
MQSLERVSTSRRFQSGHALIGVILVVGLIFFFISKWVRDSRETTVQMVDRYIAAHRAQLPKFDAGVLQVFRACLEGEMSSIPDCIQHTKDSYPDTGKIPTRVMAALTPMLDSIREETRNLQ